MSTYPNGIPSSGFLSGDIVDPGLSFTPEKVTPNLIDNHSPVNRRTMVNSHGYVLSQIANFVNATYLGRDNMPVLSGYITNIVNDYIDTDHIFLDKRESYKYTTTDIYGDFYNVATSAPGSNFNTTITSSDIVMHYSSMGGQSDTKYHRHGIVHDPAGADAYIITSPHDISLESQKYGYFYAKDSMSLASSGNINFTTFGTSTTGSINLDARSTNNYITAYADKDVDISSANGKVNLRGSLWSNLDMDLSSASYSNIIRSNIMQLTGNRVHIGTDTNSKVYVSGLLIPERIDMGSAEVPSGIFDYLECNNFLCKDVAEIANEIKFPGGLYSSATYYRKSSMDYGGGQGGKYSWNISAPADMNVHANYTINTEGGTTVNSAGTINLNSTQGSLYSDVVGSINLKSTQGSVTLAADRGSMTLTTSNSGTYYAAPIHLKTDKAPIYLQTDDSEDSAPVIAMGYGFVADVTELIRLKNTTTLASIVMPSTSSSPDIIFEGHLKSAGEIGGHDSALTLNGQHLYYSAGWQSGSTSYSQNTESNWQYIIANRSSVNMSSNTMTNDHAKLTYNSLQFQDKGGSLNYPTTRYTEYTRNGVTYDSATKVVIESEGSDLQILSMDHDVELRSEAGQADITGGSNCYYTSLNGALGLQGETGITMTAVTGDAVIQAGNDVVIDVTGEFIVDAEDNIILDTSSNSNAFITAKTSGARTSAIGDVDDKDIGLTSGRDVIIDAVNNIKFTNLPTSAPGVTGAIWNDGGVLKIVS